jgi:hypothetical protein
MKKFALLFVPLVALGIGLFFLFSGNPDGELANKQLTLIRDAVDPIATFKETGNGDEALTRLASLKKELPNWSANQKQLDKVSEQAPGEVLAALKSLVSQP